MLGDTSMGMINGYFGPRLLYPIGFSEHKVDQAWLIDRVRVGRGRTASTRPSGSCRTAASRSTGRRRTPRTSRRPPTREQLRGYLAVLDLLDEFQADCLGWQYQLGLLKLLPPSDFAEGLLNSHARPEGDGEVVITSTEADQGNLVPMELMKRLLRAKGLPGAVMFHDVRWGAPPRRPLPLGPAELGELRGVRVQSRRPEPGGRPQLPPAGRLFPGPRRHVRRATACPAPITWARAWIDRTGQLVMDLGRGESVALPDDVREAWWRGTTRQWPFMAADLGCSMETIMAHYMSNHIAVAYGDIFGEMVALSQSLGFKVRVLSS